MRKLVWGIIIAIFFAGSAISAGEESAPKKLHFFSGLFPNIASCFSGYNLIGWAAVPVATATMVNTNFDERLATTVARTPIWSHSVDVAFLQAGNFIAAVPHTIMFTYGYFWGTSEWAAAGAAGLQALGINGGIVLFLKWASGRPRPQYDPATDSTPRDKEFNFNITQQSLTSDRWRWASGHTSSMFAMVSAFYGFYPDKIWIAVAGYPTAAVMGMAMVTGGYHWSSDVAAGAIIGTIVGLTVGKNFRKMYSATKTEETSTSARRKLDWNLWPTFSAEGSGLAMVTAF